ncbi:MAG TPA: deoxyhypusine synthase family protein [Planctomycetota bacterium]|nr:deoxyhypusine synthase family protein [Planctomycetota bacterium]
MARKPKASATRSRPIGGPKHRAPDRAPTSGSRHLADGHSDHLQPVRSLDLARTDTVDALVRAMAATSFGGRTVGEAADILEAMVRDEECKVVLTLSGAMTIAKQGLIICEMIERGWVQAVVSTGALMCHGLVETAGMLHFKADPSMSDETLFDKGYNRVYDTIELEQNLDDTERLMAKVLGGIPDGETMCSHKVNRLIGKHLEDGGAGRGPLLSAFRHDVPVYVPAFTDSELGLDFATNNHRRRLAGKPPIAYDPFLDLEDFRTRVDAHDTWGIFTIGGGVPRNWAQQVAPYIDILGKRLPQMRRPLRRYKYAVRICPEPAHWGGLSGCDYSESVSWGKIVPRSEGGRWAEVKADATIAWPLVVKAVMERVGDERKGGGATTAKGGTAGGAAPVQARKRAGPPARST